jgi:hypothetical protein
MPFMDSSSRQALRAFCRLARDTLLPIARKQLGVGDEASDAAATRLAFFWLIQLVTQQASLLGHPYFGQAFYLSRRADVKSEPSLSLHAAEPLVQYLRKTPLLDSVRADPQILGWLYQYFYEPERNPFRGVRAPKVSIVKVPVMTRLFTPAWIVEALLQNTLGRLWLQMHPDSRLRQHFAYLVPLSQSSPAGVRLAREIRLLDPACGTMHFGLAAFDLFHAIYREELERAGEPGWPSIPSVTTDKQIPASILAYNLFGIDIDPDSIELSLHVLRLKAHSMVPNMSLPPAHLACVDVLQNHPSAVDACFGQKFDIILTNPPYLDRRDYEAGMKRLVESHLPDGKRNLYAAFLLRCVNLLSPGGRLGIITPQTFMFLPSFAKLRQTLADTTRIEMLIHTGLGTFAEAVVDCAFYVLHREECAESRHKSEGIYFRLLSPRSTEAKRESFLRAVTALQQGKLPPQVWRTTRADFDAFAGSPWVYWVTPGIRKLFNALPPLNTVAVPRQGLATTDNRRFVRYWWEVGKGRIAFGCRDATEARSSGKRWFPYMKGGQFRRWWGNQEWVVDWGHDGAAIKEQIVSKYPYLQGKWQWVAKNSDYYFRPGITYSYLTSARFSARYSPGGFLFDVAGSSLFPKDWRFVLAILNSRFAAYALQIINPTVNFQIGDVGRLPIPLTSSDRLGDLVEEAVALARQEETEEETSFAFIAPPNWDTGLEKLAARHQRMTEVEAAINEEVYRLYHLSAEDRAAIEAEWAQQEESPNRRSPPNRRELALQWLSYAVGVVLGRFQPGVRGALGAGRFDQEVAGRLCGLSTSEEVVPLGLGGSKELDDRVSGALTVMLGETGAEEVIHELTQNACCLKRFLAHDYYRWHVRRYHKRPVYWLLQSPRGRICFYLFFERMTAETLRNLWENYVKPLTRDTTAEDIIAFARRLQRVIEHGYTLYPDDGILLNLAPLWELMPAWFHEPCKTWKALQQGEYAWSNQARQWKV